MKLKVTFSHGSVFTAGDGWYLTGTVSDSLIRRAVIARGSCGGDGNYSGNDRQDAQSVLSHVAVYAGAPVCCGRRRGWFRGPVSSSGSELTVH